MNEIRYDGMHCSLVFQQLSRSVILMRVTGSDVGEFGDTPMRALDEWLKDVPATDFFIDAREGRGVSIDVSSDWAHWLSSNKEKLRSVTMLAGSHFIHVTADFVRRFAALEGKMRICTEASVFDGSLTEALESSQANGV